MTQARVAARIASTAGNQRARSLPAANRNQVIRSTDAPLSLPNRAVTRHRTGTPGGHHPSQAGPSAAGAW